MNTPINDGGPAFPVITSLRSNGAPDYSAHTKGGMSLRDWFAGQALAGILANRGLIDTANAEWPASFAVQCADAMLVARSKEAGK